MSSKTDAASIVKDYSRDALFDDGGMRRLKESYMREDETSPQDRFAAVHPNVERISAGHRIGGVAAVARVGRHRRQGAGVG